MSSGPSAMTISRRFLVLMALCLGAVLVPAGL
jgi:hypothetical protein